MIGAYTKISMFRAKRFRHALVALSPAAVALLLMTGCKPEKPAATERSREARARIAAAKTAESDSKRESAYQSSLTPEQRAVVVAKVGEVEITLGYVERYLSQQPAFVRARYRTFDQKVELLNNLIRFEVLAAEAEREGWNTDPDVVMAVKRAMVQKYLAEDMQRLVVVSEIGDDEAETYYKNNLDKFVKPARVRATVIVNDTQASATAVHTELTAALKADPTRARVIFRDFARARSTDKDSAWRSGDLGMFAEDGFVLGDKGGRKVPTNIVNAAFALPLNGVSEPVEADGKWWILQITNRQRRVERSLDDVKREVTRLLLRKKQDAARDTFIAGLREKADVTINEDVLNTLNVDRIRSRDPDPTTPLPKSGASLPEGEAKPQPSAPPVKDTAAPKAPTQGAVSPSPEGNGAPPEGAQKPASARLPAGAKKVLANPRGHLNPLQRPRRLDPNADLRKNKDSPSREEIEALHQKQAKE